MNRRTFLKSLFAVGAVASTKTFFDMAGAWKKHDGLYLSPAARLQEITDLNEMFPGALTAEDLQRAFESVQQHSSQPDYVYMSQANYQKYIKQLDAQQKQLVEMMKMHPPGYNKATVIKYTGPMPGLRGFLSA